MKFLVICVLIFIGFVISSPVAARLHFRRLTASEVYAALQDAGRMDAVPEGRVVTQGIAAATGFVVGVVKGVGIPLLFSLLTANRGSTNTASQGGTQTQEICFSSRSLNEIENDDEDNENDDDAEGRDFDAPEARQASPSMTTPTGTGITPTGTAMATATATGTPTDTDTGLGTGTGTETSITTDTDPTGPVNCIVVQKPANR